VADSVFAGMSRREFLAKVTAAGGAAAQGELWYLIYKDEGGVAHTVKGGTAAIRRSLKDGLLGDAENVRASRINDDGEPVSPTQPIIVRAGDRATVSPRADEAVRPVRAVDV